MSSLIKIGQFVESSDSVLELCNLRTLDLEGQALDALISVLKDSSFLEKLVLEGNFFNDQTFTKLTEALRYSKLKSISLKNSNISSQCAEVLSRALEVNTSLEVIDLSNNRIRDEGMVAISKAVVANKATKLKSLKVSMNHLTSDGVEALAPMLKLNTTIEELDIHYNIFGEYTAQKLCDALIDNKQSKLRTLNMYGCANGRGVVFFANLLRVYKPLKVLAMGANKIGDYGAELLANALQENDTLEELEISSNKIGTVGAGCLAEMLKINISLQKLDISYNDIGDMGAGYFGAALKQNRTLKKLELFHCQILEEGGLALIDALSENNILRVLNFDDQVYSFLDQEFIDFKARVADKIIKNRNVLSLKPFYELPSLQRNRDLYMNDSWSHKNHSDFPPNFHELVITFMLCNQNDKYYLPLELIWYILSIYQRKKFLNLENYNFSQ